VKTKHDFYLHVNTAVVVTDVVNIGVILLAVIGVLFLHFNVVFLKLPFSCKLKY